MLYLVKIKEYLMIILNLLVSVSEFRVLVSVSNIDTIPPGIARLIPIPRVSLNSTQSLHLSYVTKFAFILCHKLNDGVWTNGIFQFKYRFCSLFSVWQY